MTMAEPIPRRMRTLNAHGRLVEQALSEWGHYIRERYAPRSPKSTTPDPREIWEAVVSGPHIRATDEAPNPVLAALIADEHRGSLLARTVHDYLMREQRDKALLLWMEQERVTQEDMAKHYGMRKALIGTALMLVKIDLGIYLAVAMRQKRRA